MKRIVLVLGVIFASMGIWAQNVPDSIAICPPGEPAEAIERQPESEYA